MRKALILGCSHAEGYEINDRNPRLKSFPARLAIKLGYDILNKAICGGSNDAIFRVLEEEHNKLSENDIIIACWTGINRTEFLHERTGEWLEVHMYNNFEEENYREAYKGWLLTQANEKFGRLNKIKNILALNFLAKSKNLKVINVHSFWPITDFVFPLDIDFPIGVENFRDWANARNFPMTATGHYDAPAHEEFAEYILSTM